VAVAVTVAVANQAPPRRRRFAWSSALGLACVALAHICACGGSEAPAHDASDARSATDAPPAKGEATAYKGKGTSVTFPGSAGTATGYLALPDGAGQKRPALIVIQEWWGLNDWIQLKTDQFAEKGYVALAVDLYRGKSTGDPKVAHELMRGLPEDRALADLKGAFDYLAARPDVEPTKIGAIGWCMGGGYSLTLAATEPRLAAAVINYGRLITDQGAIGKVHGSILGNFAGDDRGIPVDDVKQFEASLKAAGKDADIKIYEGKGHAFINPNNKDGYDAAAAADAERRIDAFFEGKLKK
jgi:carboxymethylenebutenolidase